MTDALARLDRARDGLVGDLLLYALSAAFALVTAFSSTLAPHRAWGAVATWAYAAAAAFVAVQLWRGYAGRLPLLLATSFGAIALPLLIQSAQRATGRTDRAQEEVQVVEDGGHRLLETGTPYLDPAAIAALPADERLLGYLPYQPGMAVFGLPRAIFGISWATDARIWFFVATALALFLATRTLTTSPAAAPSSARPSPSAGISTFAGISSSAAAGVGSSVPVRALQFATVLPLCALTLATGGDDLPVLALCLLALAYSATTRWTAAGIAAGLAAALKLLAWPVVAVLLVLALTNRRARTFALGALGIPVLAMLPPLLVSPGAFVENVIRFPLGHGQVTSPAQSPLPGYLIATSLPAGRIIAATLLGLAAAAIAALLLRRPPRTAAAAAIICGYGLLTAILLMPTTRFGYLLYPAAILAWAPALRLLAPARDRVGYR